MFVTGFIFGEVCHFMFISVFNIYFILLSPFDHVWVLYWSVLCSLGGQELLSSVY